MNILLQALVVIALIVPILIGFLLGSVRGLRRSIIRLVLVALSIVLAFVLKGTITDQIMAVEVEGQPMGEYIASMLSQMLQGINVPAETVTNLTSLLVIAIVFLMSLNLLLFVTWAIIFPFCKLFLRNKKSKSTEASEGKKLKKHRKHNWLSRTLGSVLGLVQGVAVAVVCVTVLNGLFFNLSNIVASVDSMQSDSEQTETTTPAEDQEMDDSQKFLQSIRDYNDSAIRKFINKMGGDKLFDKIVCIKVEEDKTITLTGQIDAFRGVIDMGMELSKLQQMDMVGGLSGSTAEQLTEIFNKLDEINSNLSVESKEAINDLVKAVADTMLPEMDMDLSTLDFTTVNFANEGKVIADLSSYKETDMSNLSDEDSKQMAKNVVETVMQSDIILPLLSSTEQFTIGLEGENYELTKSFIEELEQNPESDKTKIDMLKIFFGLNDNAGQGGGPQDVVVTPAD